MTAAAFTSRVCFVAKMNTVLVYYISAFSDAVRFLLLLRNDIETGCAP